jgi:hypothetical protein
MMSRRKKTSYKGNQSAQPSNKKHGNSTSIKADSVVPVKSTSSSESFSPSQSTKEVTPKVTPIRPENLSLTAHAHILAYFEKYPRDSQKLNDNEVTAILQLSQHLRVFGLLSAVGFVKQTNQQPGEVKKCIRSVWELLLAQLLDPQKDSDALMTEVVILAKERPSEYMAQWRRALQLSKHWNFWAKAYQEEKTQSQTEEKSEQVSADVHSATTP